MATITPSWTENQALHASASLAAGASDTDEIDLANLGYDLVTVTVEIAFGGSPDGNVTVELLNSSNDGTSYDTIALSSVTIDEETSTTKRISLDVPDKPRIQVKVTNNDSTDNVTHESWYAGRKWDST